MLATLEKYRQFHLVSIDPGLNNIGVAIFEIQLSPFKIRRIDALTLQEGRVLDDVTYDEETAEERHYKRERMVRALMKIITDVHPTMVVCESPFFDRTRPSSFAILVEVMQAIQGAILAYDNRIRFSIFAPQLIKKTLGVAGQKGKEVVREGMEKQAGLLAVLSVSLDTLDEHAVDAIAIGYTFVLHHFVGELKDGHLS